MQRDKESVLKLVKERWKRGKRPDGDIIGEYAWFSYEMEKRAKNPIAGGNVDLIDTGALRDGLTLFENRTVEFTIFSTDEKAVKIASQYGIDVFGLTDEEMVAVVGIIGYNTNKALENYVLHNIALPR